MNYPQLKADCSQCVALCCMALAFDRSEMFAIDKAAGEPCPHLGDGHKCSVHEDLGKLGFEGCIRYDCLGAGQVVTKEIFAGKSWKDNPELAGPMMEAFRITRRVHETLELLKAMDALPLTEHQRQQKADLEDVLLPEDGWTQERLHDVEAGCVFEDAHALITSLRAQIEQPK